MPLLPLACLPGKTGGHERKLLTTRSLSDPLLLHRPDCRVAAYWCGGAGGGAWCFLLRSKGCLMQLVYWQCPLAVHYLNLLCPHPIYRSSRECQKQHVGWYAVAMGVETAGPHTADYTNVAWPAVACCGLAALPPLRLRRGWCCRAACSTAAGVCAPLDQTPPPPPAVAFGAQEPVCKHGAAAGRLRRRAAPGPSYEYFGSVCTCVAEGRGWRAPPSPRPAGRMQLVNNSFICLIKASHLFWLPAGPSSQLMTGHGRSGAPGAAQPQAAPRRPTTPL